ncbi:hypothetical protein [Archaeoglobus profundus]|uniref:DUF8121 domain-containing protein n=1 Tax=Archaeoglobus profundus (strain DSM 5631 / JCM 9629 / NBRC 100127 / Av18) TaxID=572546 RepID=D2RDV1_ARCPA|nr:hypothetical protein [Archaeoglobus profundus]ADB58295.1 hypothetical protein Arcpr_1243 [Archaeoglobus profundus DSM 5631]
MKKVYFAVAVAVCVVAGIVAVYFMSPAELTYKIEQKDQRSVLKFYDGDRDMAHLTVDTLGKKVRFSLWHKEGTVIRSLRIKITPDNPSEVYLMTLPFGWKPFKFHQGRDGLSSIFESEDLGSEETVTLEFFVVSSNSENVTIYYQVEFVIEEGLKKFVGKGEGVLKICQ